MNKKLLYVFVAGPLLSLSSCNDFLDVTPASGFYPRLRILFRDGNEIIDDPYLFFHDGGRSLRQ